MTNQKRTLVIGDVHGKLALLDRLLAETGYEAGRDRLVFIGDLVDRGESSSGVVARALKLQRESPDLVTIIRGNHEDMMIESITAAEDEADEKAELWYFNGGLETMQSYLQDGQISIPDEHIEFLSRLPTWHEDEHAIYVHAAMIEAPDGGFMHPREDPENPELLWSRNRHFFSEYRGKLVVFGHTIAGMLFGEPEKVWLRESLICVDTGAYMTGVLSAVELPSRRVYSVRAQLSEDDLSEWAGARRRLFGRRPGDKLL